MNEKEQRTQNRKVGIILGIVFIGLFIATMLGFVFGIEADPLVKKIVYWSTTIIAGIVGFCLICASLVEIIIKPVLVKLRKRRTRRVTK